jgi:hypothetical protein
MKKVAILGVTVLIFASVGLSQDQPSTPDRAPLLLVQQIPLPNVGGRIDHFTFDAKRKRVLWNASNQGTVVLHKERPHVKRYRKDELLDDGTR